MLLGNFNFHQVCFIITKCLNKFIKNVIPNYLAKSPSIFRILQVPWSRGAWGKLEWIYMSSESIVSLYCMARTMEMTEGTSTQSHGWAYFFNHFFSAVGGTTYVYDCDGNDILVVSSRTDSLFIYIRIYKSQIQQEIKITYKAVPVPVTAGNTKLKQLIHCLKALVWSH